MEETLRDVVHHVALVVEAIGAFIIAVGVLVAFVRWVGSEIGRGDESYEDVRLRLGRFLALGLEFQLGADILGTAVTPSWTEIGKLGAIAGIRTALNYFLALELERSTRPGPSPAGGVRS